MLQKVVDLWSSSLREELVYLPRVKGSLPKYIGAPLTSDRVVYAGTNIQGKNWKRY